MLLFIAIFLIMLKRREVLLININGITPEPEIQARYTVHKKRGVYLLPDITPEPEIQARYTVHKKKGVYLPLITGSLGVVP